MPDMPERCPMCGAPERRQLLVGNYVASNATEYECETMVIEGGETAESTNCLRRQRDAARAEAERLQAENEHLYSRIERLEARVARQRVMLYRLQEAIKRRNSEERIEAMRRALHDETVERYMREYDAAADEAERWRQQYEALLADLAAAHAVIEAARRVVNNEYDVDPADVYELGEAIRRYDERCGGVSQ